MVKIATWNVNSIGARLERLLAFLAREQPDVVCLQELKTVTEKFPFEALSAAGYEAAAYGQKTYNGVAILARGAPLENVQRGFGEVYTDEAARLVAATFKGIRILSVYVPNGQAVGSEKYAYKLAWLEGLKAYLERYHVNSEPLVVAGDFNVAPQAIDVFDPAALEGQLLCSEAERAALSAVCRFGLVDLFRLHQKAEGIYSWWDYRQLAFPRNRGLRIDLLLATPGVAGRSKAAWIDRNERKGEKASDHAPVLVELG